LQMSETLGHADEGSDAEYWSQEGGDGLLCNLLILCEPGETPFVYTKDLSKRRGASGFDRCRAFAFQQTLYNTFLCLYYTLWAIYRHSLHSPPL